MNGEHDGSGTAGRRVVATAVDLSAAQRAVACLVAGGISEDHTDIVARGLRPASWVAGRRSTPDVLLHLGLLGAAVGVLAGWLLIASDLVALVVGPVRMTVSAALLGAVFGGSVGLAGYGILGSRGSIAPPGLVRADHYDVAVDTDLIDRAVQILQGGAMGEQAMPRA